MRRVCGEVGDVLGYLGASGVLYCSAECACEDGQPWAMALDLDEYDAIANHGRLTATAPCPICGREYAVR